MKQPYTMALYWRAKGEHRSRPKIPGPCLMDFCHGLFADMTDWWEKYGYFAKHNYCPFEWVEEPEKMTMVQEWDEWLYAMSVPQRPGYKHGRWCF
jgi:hypothetical protein